MTRRSVSLKQWIGLAILLLLGWLGAFALRVSAPAGRDMRGSAVVAAILADRDAPRFGPKNADVTVVVFSDYQCPVCKRTEPALMDAIDHDGRVRIVYRDWPIFGPVSERAARVALAARYQGLYVAMHDRLMQSRIAPTDPVLAQTVRSAGGDWPRLLRDLDTHRSAIDRLLIANGNAAAALGLPGTPAYLIGTTLIIGATGKSGFKHAIRSARKI